MLKGVVAEDLLSVTRGLLNKGWFSLEKYNSTLKDFGWLSYELSDKPQPVPLSRKVAKLKGKAVSQWTHIRNWPLIVKKFILDEDDMFLSLGLKLHEVTERITATEFVEYEIQLLEESIIDYLDMRKKVRSEFPDTFKKPKPKHHFMREIFKKYQKCLIENIIYKLKIFLKKGVKPRGRLYIA